MNLTRLLKPRSICVIGGQAAERVIEQCRRMDFPGAIYAVHPERRELAGAACYRRIGDLPEAPDAAFIAVRRDLTVAAARELAARGAGGAVCYASGFNEAGEAGGDWQAALVAAAGAMPVIGPNCHGFINYLDNVALWPDQHGGERVARGAAILTQSGNIAITLTMQRRGLPLAVVATLGNWAAVSAAAVMDALLDDDRITAIGLVIETVGDAAQLAAAAAKARRQGVPVAALKLGRSETGARLALSHTASLAGSAAVTSAFLKRIGIAEAPSVPALLETLKLLHVGGPLPGREVASLSCSGGEAALMADALAERRLCARALTAVERRAVQATLSELVTASNPLDYHTFIWGDAARLTAAFSAMLDCGFDLGILVIDLPRTDRCGDADWRTTLDAFTAACDRTGCRGAVLATLPESLTEALARDLVARGIAPLAGVEDGLAAIEAAADIGAAFAAPAPRLDGLRSLAAGPRVLLTEWQAKQQLSGAGVPIPSGGLAESPQAAVTAAQRIGLPVAVKAVGPEMQHKSDRRALRLDLHDVSQVAAAAAELLPFTGSVLVERMVGDGVAELIVGVNRDPQMGLVLLLGSGGERVELAADRALLVPPASRAEIETALAGLKAAALLQGFRGRPAGDLAALVDAVLAIQRFALESADRLIELDVNPLIARPRGRGVVAADALIHTVQGEAP